MPIFTANRFCLAAWIGVTIGCMAAGTNVVVVAPPIPAKPPRALTVEQTKTLQKEAQEVMEKEDAKLRAIAGKDGRAAACRPDFYSGGLIAVCGKHHTLLPKGSVVQKGKGEKAVRFPPKAEGQWLEPMEFMKTYSTYFEIVRGDRVDGEVVVGKERLATAKKTGRTVVVICDGRPAATFR